MKLNHTIAVTMLGEASSEGHWLDEFQALVGFSVIDVRGGFVRGFSVDIVWCPLNSKFGLHRQGGRFPRVVHVRLEVRLSLAPA